MKLFIMTDLEGVTGIVDWDKHAEASPEERERQEFLMANDVNAAVEGALCGGADEVWVAECHTIDIRDIHPEAMLWKNSAHRLTPSLLGMKKGRWDAAAFIGNHPMAGTKNGVLSHTQNGRVKSIHINGLLVGEFGIEAAVFGDFGMPVIMMSGDREACKQAAKLVPDIERVSVKQGTGTNSAWCMSPVKSAEAIAAGMERAVKKWKKVKPFKIKGPIEFREELYDGMVRVIKARTVAEAFEKRCSVNV